MPATELTSEWTELSLANGWAQNRGASTIECSDVEIDGQASYYLLALASIVTREFWGQDAIFMRKSQTSSPDSKAIIYING